MKTWLSFSWLHLQEYPPAQFHPCSNPLLLVICFDNLQLWCAGFFSSVSAVPPSASSPGHLLAGHQLLWQELPKASSSFYARLCLGSSRFVRTLAPFPLRPPNRALGKGLGLSWALWGHTPGSGCQLCPGLPSALAHSSHLAVSPKPGLHHFCTRSAFFFSLWLISHLMPSVREYKRFGFVRHQDLRLNPVSGL